MHKRPASVDSVNYMGGYLQLQLYIGERLWTIQAPAHTAAEPDQTVMLHLPPSHLWLGAVDERFAEIKKPGFYLNPGFLCGPIGDKQTTAQ